MPRSTLTIEEWKTEQQLFAKAVSVNSSTPLFPYWCMLCSRLERKIGINVFIVA